MSFYQLKHFQCEVTGKSGLNYFEALESEQQEARTLHSRFPEPLKAAVLRSVQWREFFTCIYLITVMLTLAQRSWGDWTILLKLFMIATRIDISQTNVSLSTPLV